jgi:hypothetical protein
MTDRERATREELEKNPPPDCCRECAEALGEPDWYDYVDEDCLFCKNEKVFFEWQSKRRELPSPRR